MSLDTESLLKPEAIRLSKVSSVDYTRESMGIVWIISTSGTGITVRFNIRRLRSSKFGLSGRKKHFGHVLPEAFGKQLSCDTIVKVGLGILGDVIDDFNPADITVKPVLELQWLVHKAKGAIYNDDISRPRLRLSHTFWLLLQTGQGQEEQATYVGGNYASIG